MLLKLILLLLLCPMVGHSATYWVSKSGSDSNACNASASPLTTTAKLSIQGGKNCIGAAGDTVRVSAGTYAESWNWTGTSGTSGNPVTIEANPGEAVTWAVPSGAQQATDILVNWGILRGIKFDGSTGSNCLHHSEGVCGNPSPGSNPYTTIPVSGSNMLITISGTDIVVENCEFTQSAYGVLLLNTPAARFTFRGNNVHQIGKIWNANNMYLKAPDSVFEGNTMYEMCGGALSFYTADTSSQIVNNVIARNNYIERSGYFWAPTAQNGTRTDTGAQITQGTVNTSHGSGISLSRGNGQKIYNNVVVNSMFPIGTGDNVSGCLIANNSIYGNLAGGFGLGDGYAALSIGSGTSVCEIHNNIVYTPGVTSPPPMFNGGSSNTFSNNTCSSTSASLCANVRNPLFVNANGGDLRLQSNSPEIDTGVNLSASIGTTDIISITRPQGAAWDRGAYEFTSADPPDPAPTGLGAKWPFDNTANDVSGNGNNGSLTVTATFASPGTIGTHALQLNGSGSRVEVPSSASLKPSATGGFSAWFKLSAIAPLGCVIMGTERAAMWIRQNGSFSCWVQGSQYIEIGGSSSAVNNQWNHGVCTWNSSTFQAYVNNTIIASSAAGITPTYTGDEPFWIGDYEPNPEYYCTGLIDQAYSSNDFYTQTAVANLFSENVPLGDVSMVNWQFVADNSSQSLMGTLNSGITHQLGANIGLEVGVTNNSGSQIVEYLPIQCARNGGTMTTVTNSFGSLGVRIATSPFVNMGDTIDVRLPSGGQTEVDGRAVADTIDTGQKTTLPHGGYTQWRYVLSFGSPATACDVYQCRVVRENGAAMTHYGDDTVAFLPTITLSEPTAQSAGTYAGGTHAGGSR